MESLLGTSIPVFIGITLFLIGGATYMTGQALALTWRPVWQVFPYCLLLGFADRFLVFSLFGGELLSFSGYLIDTSVLILICLTSYRITQVRKIIQQYPWLYRQKSLLGYSLRTTPPKI